MNLCLILMNFKLTSHQPRVASSHDIMQLSCGTTVLVRPGVSGSTLNKGRVWILQTVRSVFRAGEMHHVSCSSSSSQEPRWEKFKFRGDGKLSRPRDWSGCTHRILFACLSNHLKIPSTMQE